MWLLESFNLSRSVLWNVICAILFKSLPQLLQPLCLLVYFYKYIKSENKLFYLHKCYVHLLLFKHSKGQTARIPSVFPASIFWPFFPNLLPNAWSAHPSCWKADDWLPRTAPRNNSPCMISVTEERKLPNSLRYNLLKIAAIKNPRCSLHPVFVCWRCACAHECVNIYGVVRQKYVESVSLGASQRDDTRQRKRLTDRASGTVNG